MSIFLDPAVWPFFLAAVLLVALALVESLSLLVGVSPSHWLDSAAADIDHGEGLSSATLGWLHIGKVPVLVILVTFLTSFAVVGFAIQFVVQGLTGHFLPPVVPAIVAGLAALGAVRVFGKALARIIPADETNAATDASLVGRVATIVIGTATQGKPAEGRVRDQYGNTQYVMVEPAEADQTLQSGTSVLLVRQVGGRRFQAIPNPKPDLL